MAMMRQSKKRDAMLSLLQSVTDHPSADRIYQQLKPRYPDLSLGTVYRNLGLLCGQGLVKRVGTVNGQERYDGQTSPHSHFICNRCGSVLDLPDLRPGGDLEQAVSSQYGFAVERCELTFYGLCPSCLHQLGVQYGFIVQDCEFVVRGLCRDCADRKQF